MQIGSNRYNIGSENATGVTAEDIANSLAKLNRFTGHSIVPYSVAQHSVVVSDLMFWERLPYRLCLYGLLHDIGEVITNDITWPIKEALRQLGAGDALHLIENAAEVALFRVLGVPPMTPEIKSIVKRYDMIALATERRDVMPYYSGEWSMNPYPPHEYKIEPSNSWAHDAESWLAAFRFYSSHMHRDEGELARRHLKL